MIENLPRLWIYVALRISFGVDLAEFYCGVSEFTSRVQRKILYGHRGICVRPCEQTRHKDQPSYQHITSIFGQHSPNK